MPAGRVLIDCVPGAAPDPVRALNCVEAAALCCLSERSHAEALVGEGGQRYEARWTGDVRHDEAIEVVDHRPGDDLTERAVVTLVGSLQSTFSGLALHGLGDRAVSCTARGRDVVDVHASGLDVIVGAEAVLARSTWGARTPVT